LFKTQKSAFGESRVLRVFMVDGRHSWLVSFRKNVRSLRNAEKCILRRSSQSRQTKFVSRCFIAFGDAADRTKLYQKSCQVYC